MKVLLSNLTTESIISELNLWDEYKEMNLSELNDNDLYDIWNAHIEKNSYEIEAKELIKTCFDESVLIDTPDGYQFLGDFYIKSERNIYETVTYDGRRSKVSEDHLFETPIGWVKAKELKSGDLILTKDGMIAIKSNDIFSFEEVYDWEVLHENHRYWTASGLSSHNTGKTFLSLNICREAQQMGYDIIYCDSEAAVDEDIFVKFGLDPERVRYQPVGTVQEFSIFVNNLTKTLGDARKSGAEVPKVMLVLDSLGNLASTKEKEDQISGKQVRDMTKQQVIRSMFRTATIDLAAEKIPFLITNHTYQCASGETEIIMSDGIKLLKDIEIGDEVMTAIGARKVTNKFEYEKTLLYRVTLEDGSIIECTDQHKLLVGDNPMDEASWKTLSELKEGDEIKKINCKYTKTANLKIASIEPIGLNTVYDIEIEEAKHYVAGNGVFMHNSIGLFASKEISGGGGVIFNPSIILMLSKAKLKEDDKDAKNAEMGATGIVVSSYVKKNRFAKPIPVKFHISFFRGMNRYTGLEKYISWNNCGIGRGKMISEKEFQKLKPNEKAEYDINRYSWIEKTKNGEEIKHYFMPKETARSLVAKHLNREIKPVDLFTSDVITDDLLHELDDKVIKPLFMLPDITGLEELASVVDELDGVEDRIDQENAELID